MNFRLKQITVVASVAITITGLAACGGGGGGVGGGGAASKSWGTAQLIETDNTGNAASAQIAFDSSGNAIAVWAQYDGAHMNIWANHYTAGSGWGAPTLIETDDTGDTWDPQIAFDPSGNAMAVWSQSDGAHVNIWSNRYTAGSGWGTAQLIETDDTGDAWYPQVAVDSNGNAVAVWTQSDGARENIWANRYTAGSGWGTAQLIETDDVGNTFEPQIAVDSNGNAIAVWSQFDGARNNIWANRYTVGSGWGTAALIETDNTSGAVSAQIAFDPGGNAIAVWAQHDGTRMNIWSNRYTAGSGWGTAQLIETNNAGAARHPQIAFDPSGNAMAVWQQSDGTRDNIWANRYTAGSGWGTARRIETGNAGDAWFPRVSFDGHGNAMAVWQQSDGTRFNIWANRYTPGSGWGTARRIETDNAGNAWYPQIASDANGNAIAVWAQHDGARFNVWVNQYQ